METQASSFPIASVANDATSWFLNRTSWAANLTRYAPSWENLRQAGPRALTKLGLMTITADYDQYEALDVTTLSRSPISFSTSSETNIAAASQSDPLSNATRLSMDSARGLGSVFNYATSKWALSCIAMALVLNRTAIFAATRRRIRLGFRNRLLLRIVPVVLLSVQACWLLQSIQCQTSAEFSNLRWGDSEKSSELMFAHPSSFLNALSSFLLFGSSDKQSCLATRMIPAQEEDTIKNLRGSLSLLWPLFGTFCLGHFLETLSSALQGIPLMVETGMTLFELSLAFAEADAAISGHIGWGAFTKQNHSEAINMRSAASQMPTRAMVMRRVNTPREVLLIAFISTMTHLTSHVLGVFKLQNKYRLLNTGFWGLCYMVNIAWSIIVFDLDDSASQGLLRYPTVCLIGFVPHVMVLLGIILCVAIYVIAITVSAAARPSSEAAPLTFRQRLIQAHENMQANVSLSEIRISRQMDFYSALLRTGLAAISMASEAVYLNEDGRVGLKDHTWLEEARYQEAEELQRQWLGMSMSNTKYDQIGTIGLIPIKNGPLAVANGYGRERAAQKVSKTRGEKRFKSGLGATERSSRWLMALDYLICINRLLLRIGAKAMLWILALLHIRYQPAWLLWLARNPKDSNDATERGPRQPSGSTTDRQRSVEFEEIPVIEGLDVEAEFRRIDRTQNADDLDKDLYNYWKQGGWWGSADGSGEYQPDADDDNWDMTSVVTTSTAVDAGSGIDEYPWETDDDGLMTPTLGSPQRMREPTPVVDSPLGMRDLARLLHPENKEQRDEAKRLAAHLESNTVMTRAGFRRLEHLERTRVLTTPGTKSRTMQASRHIIDTAVRPRIAKLSPEDEERLLEQLLIARRQAARQAPNDSSWDQGGSGMGSDGPQCVVCQSSSRTIIVWPCRCLSLCDDCRVSLAMNNFDKCVCCRREVISFSRIYVP